MLDSTSLTSLEDLQQLLKMINERLTYLERVVIPSRVTNEELHSRVADVKIFVMRNVASLRNDVRALKDQMLTKEDIERLKP